LQNFVQSETVWQGNKQQAQLAKPCRRGKFCKISFSARLYGKLTSKQAQLAKPCRRGKFCKISFSPRLYGKLTTKQAQLAEPCRRVNFAKFRSVRDYMASLQASKLSQNGAKLTPVWLTAPPRLLSVYWGSGARAPS
jgi:hypothetical protein